MTRAGRRPVTMADVGAAAGVSSRTVSNVLSGKVPVNPETREAVLKAVEGLGYQMNVPARALRTGRTGLITLALPDLAIDYFADFARAVIQEAEERDWSVTLLETGADRDRELDILNGSSRRLSDGLIIQPHGLWPSDHHLVVADGPLVLLGERILGANVDHITMANAAAARTATEHLIALGRHRVAVVGPDPDDHPDTSGTLRLRGYRTALAAAGLPYAQELISETHRWVQAEGAAAVQVLLDRGVRFDGLFCLNDTLALGALQVLHRHAIRVPQDVAVVGFDNVTAARYSHPPLTTIDPGGPYIAQQAVSLLASRVNEAPSRAPQRMVAEFHLVKRGSTVEVETSDANQAL